ncbi:helix-turn-helix domain-containing protein [Paracoccus sp. P2]|uniref:helix-turn-helix domain-containing protein n=1 Tax=Paracoccus sp. P2 TaxID=3248840 RepID=UPI00391FB43A
MASSTSPASGSGSAICQHDLSTDDAAAICGVSRATIYRYFNLTREPKAEHVAATIEATGCDAKWLLTGIRTAEPEPPRTDYYIDLFTAFLAARTAYEAYERAYQDPSTRHSIPAEITRRVYEAGKRLDKVGGYEAMTGAVYAFYPNDDDRRVALLHKSREGFISRIQGGSWDA